MPQVKYLLLVLVVMLTSHASATEAADPKFTSILSKNKLTCAKPNSICWLKEDGTKFAVWFTSSVDETNNFRSITAVHIKNQKTKEVQSFPVKSIERVELNEPVKIYRTKLRKGGPADLAFFTNLSPHNGPLYYYFVYDGTSKKFVMTSDEVPRLIYGKEDNLLHSEVKPSEILYELDPTLHLKQKFLPSNKTKSSGANQ